MPFLSGLITILTPVTFLMIFLLLIAFNHLSLRKKTNLKPIIIFCGSVVLLYSIIGISILNLPTDISKVLSPNGIINNLTLLLNLTFGVWLMGVLKNVSIKNKNSTLWKNLLILLFAIVFSFGSFSNSGPIIGSLLINDLGDQSYFNKITPLVFFSLGLIIPVGLLLISLEKVIRKASTKKWWEFFRFLTGLAFITLTIIGQIIK
ncbi:hypothetical protein [Xanthovirga aplysinae]|uniref:hypothetical protein n=1 Tax=Xanthovirga aplysinae TaxID=2529853 RepID=UPI0012BBB5FD|nr:hypothetical protein [Xanthovirga aplysinae]MTI30174.1 hypothetical protein [Xanthovirga aplysinae]